MGLSLGEIWSGDQSRSAETNETGRGRRIVVWTDDQTAGETTASPRTRSSAQSVDRRVRNQRSEEKRTRRSTKSVREETHPSCPTDRRSRRREGPLDWSSAETRRSVHSVDRWYSSQCRRGGLSRTVHSQLSNGKNTRWSALFRLFSMRRIVFVNGLNFANQNEFPVQTCSLWTPPWEIPWRFVPGKSLAFLSIRSRSIMVSLPRMLVVGHSASILNLKRTNGSRTWNVTIVCPLWNYKIPTTLEP